jgi:hypothetical protein
MLIERHLPACDLVSIRAVDVDADAGVVWEALPDAPRRLTPTGFFRSMLWLASLVRGDLFRRRSWGTDRLILREGETIPFPADPYSEEGLRVEELAEKREVVVKGSHRYSEYFASIFVEALRPDRTRVYVATRAQFSHSFLGSLYLRGVRLLHDPIVEWGLRRLKRFVEAEGGGGRG